MGKIKYVKTRDIVFIFFSAVPNRFKYRQNACFRDSILKRISAIPNHFKYRQNACFRDFVLNIFSEVIQVVSNSDRLPALPCFLFKIVAAVPKYHFK
mgnify:FL=1